MARKEAGAYKSTQSGSMAWALLFLRLFLGGMFLKSGVENWSWLGTDHVSKTLTEWTTGDTPAAFSTYISFLTRFIVPHARVYTYLVVLGEVLVGGLMVLGITTRLVVVPALFMSINFLLATWNLGFEWQGINEAFIAMELVVMLGGAGRFLGIDAAFARKKPNWPIW